MCLALIAINQHPHFSLIIASNRDEFYTRATTSARFWPDEPYLYAGQDLQSGGTWLGTTQFGTFALLTNYRDPSQFNPERPSRGLLCKEYLTQKHPSPATFLKLIAAQANKYNGFNLIVGNGADIHYYSNQNNTIQHLDSGLYGLSNHLLDTPWFKVERAKTLCKQALLINEPRELTASLQALLLDQTKAPITKLPKTGISSELELALSSIFVQVPSYNYGTQSSTVILSDGSRFYVTENGKSVDFTIRLE